MASKMLRNLVVVAAMLTSLPAAAAELSLEQALRTAVEGNQAVRNARFQEESAEANLVASKAGFDPQLAVSANASTARSTQPFGNIIFDQDTIRYGASTQINGQLPTGTSYDLSANLNLNESEQLDFQRSIVEQQPFLVDQFNRSPSIALTLSQEVLRGHSMAFNRRNVVDAESALTVAQLQVKAQEMRTVRDVARFYWTWVASAETAKIAEERVTVAQEALRIGELQLGEGRLARVDVTRLRTEFVRARKALLDAQNTASSDRDNLLVLMGREPGMDVEPGTPMSSSVGAPISEADAIEAAKAGNIDLRVQRAQMDQASLSLRMAKHGLLPSLQVSGTANFSQPTNKIGDDPSNTTNNRNLSGRATLSVPLGNRAARGDVARAAATEAQRRNDLAGSERETLTQVAQQARIYASAAAQIELADLEVELAEQTLQAEEARAEVGRAVQRDVLEARVAVFDAKLAATRARADAQLARIELLLLQGTLDIGSATGS